MRILSKKTISRTSMFVLALLYKGHLFAQADPGLGALSQISSTIKRYQGPVRNALFAVAAIIALFGAFTIYTKMQNDDQDIKPTLLKVVGGCILFVVLATALPSFFA